MERGDERRRLSCQLCNRVEAVHRVRHRDRDIEDEVRIQDYAAGLAPSLRNPSAAFAMAHARALPGPIRYADTRNNAQEVKEECTDALNYATWEIQLLERQGGSEASKMLWNGVIIKAVELFDAVVAAEHPEG